MKTPEWIGPASLSFLMAGLAVTEARRGDPWTVLPLAFVSGVGLTVALVAFLLRRRRR